MTTQRQHDGKFVKAQPTPIPNDRFTRIHSVMDRHDNHKAALADLMIQLQAAKVLVADLQAKIDSRKLELERARAEASGMLFGSP